MIKVESGHLFHFRASAPEGGILDGQLVAASESEVAAQLRRTGYQPLRITRLKKLLGSSTTLYIGDDIERDTTGAFTDCLNADVKRIAGATACTESDRPRSAPGGPVPC